ncbi:hypothetical protein [Aurantiacibacter sp. D1-12]|uniref:hypothetical protein n=1 Tax=Aurantiacibacter sp. D1-12 TaxID=2993658 RepID=UPI00237C6F58|nr:hypothetical protein [Aurantiacibacter sp. D1-12]MDE1467068.1 hypothetical protein [Aurantiacibacter sp. D1-12]
MRFFALGSACLALTACATPEHSVSDEVNLLAEPRGAETLTEQILREGQGDGCLVAGNAGRNRDGLLRGFNNHCRDLRDVIAPPEPPPGIEIAPPPPPPPPPARPSGTGSGD